MFKQLLSVGAMALALTFAAVGECQDRDLNWAEKMFSELSYNFGTVARGSDVRHQIILENPYEGEVRFSVRTLCGCTIAKTDREVLGPHEKAVIELKMDTIKFMRQKDSGIDVSMTYRSPRGEVNSTTVRVPVSVYIRPDVVVTPGQLDFGGIEYGTGSQRRIEVAYAGTADFRVEDVRIGSENLKATVREVSRTRQRVNYELLVTLDEGTKIGTLQSQLVLLTNDPRSPEVPIPVTGRVNPDIIVSPSPLPLGRLSPGEQKTFTVVVKGKRPFVIESVSSEVKDCFEVMKLAEAAKPVHVLQFRVTAPEEAGEFEDRLMFAIKGREEPVTVDTTGVIGDGTLATQ